MRKSGIGLLLLAISLAACAMPMSDSTDASGQAFAVDTRAADCDRRARSVTDPEESVASSAPLSGTPWTTANEWAVSTAGSKAQIERDIRQRHYEECVGLR